MVRSDAWFLFASFIWPQMDAKCMPMRDTPQNEEDCILKGGFAVTISYRLYILRRTASFSRKQHVAQIWLTLSTACL